MTKRVKLVRGSNNLTQPRLNALLRGKIGQFSLDALVNTATRAGLHVELHVTSSKRAGARAAAAA